MRATLSGDAPARLLVAGAGALAGGCAPGRVCGAAAPTPSGYQADLSAQTYVKTFRALGGQALFFVLPLRLTGVPNAPVMSPS